MQPIPQCTRCGYATAPAFPRCWCCGRPLYRCARARRAHRERRRHRFWSMRRTLRSFRSSPDGKEDLAELIAAW